MRWQRRVSGRRNQFHSPTIPPTVIVDGQAHTDDMLDTGLVEELPVGALSRLGGDIVSAGYRVGNTAAPDVVSL